MFKLDILFLERVAEAKAFALSYVDQMKACEIYVFGSLARGDVYPKSDIDLMFLIDGNLKDVDAATDIIMCDLSANFETKYPLVDAHACRRDKFYDTTDNGTVFDGFIAAVREEGIRIWHR